MNQSMQPAIQHLFQASSLEAVTREQLETFVYENPCFGFGHYLLSLKLQTESSDQFLAATQKTSLYFSNPFWLQWMLDHHPEPATQYHRTPEPAPVPESTSTPDLTHIPAPIRDEEPPFVLDEPAPIPEPTPTPEPAAPSTAAELLLESIEKAKAIRESLEKINEDYHSHNGHPEEPPFVLDEPEPSSPAPIAESAPSPIPEPPAPPIPEPATPLATEPAPLFEPLHTIDYFASQGIRLTLDENPTDPLGRQLKSFTEWLRTMRRLPQKDREIVPDRVSEQNIQNFAAHSIEGKEPVTETMAEVLAKQGMPERARIVYEKLSLLNPDKSAYFATKIEQLNIH